MQATGVSKNDATPWWREWEVGALLILVLAIYFSRLTTLPIRGEETRRAMVAREILWTGDWIIPRQQGEPFLSRPPLGSYPIVLASLFAGDTTVLATRLPTALATLLTSLLVYGYCRQRLSALGSLGAALGYATAGQVMQLGQTAETEATFTLLLAGSLLLWHWGYTNGWSKYGMWSAAYLCVALGALAKGPQAPVYFATTIGAFLIYRRQWRALFHPAHFVGIGLFTLVLGAWHIPFALQLGWPAVEDVWAGDVGLRFVDQTWLTWLEHVATFPAEVGMYLLPSSLLLLAFVRPSFWKTLQRDAPWLSFAAIAIAVTFPTCWLVPGAKPRYFMPLYPCVAVFMGVVIDRLAHGAAHPALAQTWRFYQRFHLGAALGIGAAAIALASWPALPFAWLRISPLSAALLAAMSASAALVLFYNQSDCSEANLRRGLLAAAAVAGVAYTGLVTTISLRRSEDIAAPMAELKAQLPSGTQLVSFGLIETMFTYHYNDPVTLLAPPEELESVPADVKFFCMNFSGGKLPRLPFAWQKEAILSCDRWKRDQPQRMVVVGRRLADAVALSQADGEPVLTATRVDDGSFLPSEKSQHD